MNARPLEITSLTKVFDTPSGPMTVVKNFDTRIRAGEFVALLTPPFRVPRDRRSQLAFACHWDSPA